MEMKIFGELIPSTQLVQHPLSQGAPPEWASAWGQDEFGVWAEVSVRDKRKNKDVTQRFRWIREGSFMMGSPEDEEGRYDDEVQHLVTLTKGFWLADTACTQELWMAVMEGENPSRFEGDLKPVEKISWDDCVKFFEILNDKVPSLQSWFPTEAQWEYACRAGTQGPNNFQEKISSELVKYNSSDGTVKVKSLPPNAWGLYETHGNVWEWCADYWREHITENETDPNGPKEGSYRVYRGGSWVSNAWDVRAAYRGRRTPDDRVNDLGFRFSPGQAGQKQASGGRFR